MTDIGSDPCTMHHSSVKAYQLCKPDIEDMCGEYCRIGTLSGDIYFHEDMARIALDRAWDEWFQEPLYPIDELVLDADALMEVGDKYEWAKDMGISQVDYSCTLMELHFNYKDLTNEQLRLLLSHCRMGPFLEEVNVHTGTLWQVWYPVLENSEVGVNSVYTSKEQAEVGLQKVRDHLRLTYDLSINIEGKLLDYDGFDIDPYLVEVYLEGMGS